VQFFGVVNMAYTEIHPDARKSQNHKRLSRELIGI
jgi:hypothetical protein